MKMRWLFIPLLFWQSSVMAANGNLRFMDDTPISHFNDRDIQMLQETIDKALNEAPDGTTVNWANKSTGASGTITPKGRFERAGSECRKARATTKYKTLTGGGEFNFCKSAEGNWQLVQ
jgi:surface antigen